MSTNTTEFTITKTPAYTLPDGNSYPTMLIAQRAAMLRLVMADNRMDDCKNAVNEEMANPVLDRIFQHLDAVKSILSCTGRRPRKAKGNGATRKRKTVVKAGGAE